MGNEITTQQNFAERFTERVKKDIGELLTNEELKKMIERSMEEIFFKEKTAYSSYGPDKVTPPFLHSIVKELIEEKVRSETEKWIAKNDDEVLKVTKKCLSEGVGVCLINAISSIFHNQMYNFQQELNNRIESMTNNY